MAALDKNMLPGDNKRYRKTETAGHPAGRGGTTMRVIAGDARGRRLEALPGTDVTRPTLSQVKEAMFSIVPG